MSKESTYIAIGPHCWGVGEHKREAVENCRRNAPSVDSPYSGDGDKVEAQVYFIDGPADCFEIDRVDGDIRYNKDENNLQKLHKEVLKERLEARKVREGDTLHEMGYSGYKVTDTEYNGMGIKIHLDPPYDEDPAYCEDDAKVLEVPREEKVLIS
jgi:hypothetical protein